jgi:hypothetical protein
VLDTPTAGQDDLQQAPVLWISGKSDFNLGPDAGRRLRGYIDTGGFVFAEACCPKSEDFDHRLRQLVGELDLEGVLIHADALHTQKPLFGSSRSRGPTSS